jgi:hypothetical protein
MTTNLSSRDPIKRDTDVHEDCTLEVSQEFKDLCQLFRENQITLDVLFNLMVSICLSLADTLPIKL